MEHQWNYPLHSSTGDETTLCIPHRRFGAHERAKQKQLLRFIERFAFARTKEVTVRLTARAPLKLFHLNHFLPREWLCTNDHGTHVNALEATFTHDT